MSLVSVHDCLIELLLVGHILAGDSALHSVADACTGGLLAIHKGVNGLVDATDISHDVLNRQAEDLSDGTGEAFHLAVDGHIVIAQALPCIPQVTDHRHIASLHIVALHNGHDVLDKGDVPSRVQAVQDLSGQSADVLLSIGLLLVIISACVHEGYQDRVEDLGSNHSTDCGSAILPVATLALKQSVSDYVDAGGRLCHKCGSHLHAGILGAHQRTSGEYGVIDLGLGDDLGKSAAAQHEEGFRVDIQAGILVVHLTLHSFPDCTPCDLVSQRRGLGEGLVTVVAVSHQRLHLLLEAGILLTLDEVLGGLTHVSIEVAHLFDDGHRCILLDLIPQGLVALVVHFRADEVFGIHQGCSSRHSGRLLYHNGQRGEDRTLLEQAHQRVDDAGSRIRSCTAVQVSDELLHIAHSRRAVCVLDGTLHGHRRLSFQLGAVVVEDPVEVLQRKHEGVVHTHVIHMAAPHIHEVAQDHRVVGVGYHLIGEAGVLDPDLTGDLILLKHKLLCRLQREVELLLEQLHAIHLHGDLVTLGTHYGGQIVLHLIHKALLIVRKIADDVCQDIRRDLVGICSIHLVLDDLTALLLIGLDVTVEHEATQLQVFMCLLTLGISIQGQDLVEGQLKLQTGARLKAVLLLEVPGVIAILLGLVQVVFPGLGHIDCPYILTFSHGVEGFCQGVRSHMCKGIHRLQVVPEELPHRVEHCHTHLMLATGHSHLANHSGCQGADGLLLLIQEGLVGISYSGQDHLVHIVHIGKLLDGHVPQRGVADRACQLLQAACNHRVIGVGDVRIIRILNLLVGITQFLQPLAHLIALAKDVLHRLGIGSDLIRVSFLGDQRSVLSSSLLSAHGIHVHQSQRISHSFLQAVRHMALLIIGQQKLVQLANHTLDLVSHEGLLTVLNAPLPGLLPSIHQLSLGLGSSFLIGSQSLLALLLSFLIGQLLLSGKDILQRLGCLQTEKNLIVGVDTVGSLSGLKLEVTDRLGISRSLGEAQLLDLLIQLAELALLGIDEVDLALVLPDLVSLKIVLSHTLKGIGQQRTVRHGVGITVLIKRLSLSQHRFLHLVRDGHRPDLGAGVQSGLAYPGSPLLAVLVQELGDVLVVLDGVALQEAALTLALFMGTIVCPSFVLGLSGSPADAVIVLLSSLTKQSLQDILVVGITERCIRSSKISRRFLPLMIHRLIFTSILGNFVYLTLSKRCTISAERVKRGPHALMAIKEEVKNHGHACSLIPNRTDSLSNHISNWRSKELFRVFLHLLRQSILVFQFGISVPGLVAFVVPVRLDLLDKEHLTDEGIHVLHTSVSQNALPILPVGHHGLIGVGRARDTEENLTVVPATFKRVLPPIRHVLGFLFVTLVLNLHDLACPRLSLTSYGTKSIRIRIGDQVGQLVVGVQSIAILNDHSLVIGRHLVVGNEVFPMTMDGTQSILPGIKAKVIVIVNDFLEVISELLQKSSLKGFILMLLVSIYDLVYHNRLKVCTWIADREIITGDILPLSNKALCDLITLRLILIESLLLILGIRAILTIECILLDLQHRTCDELLQLSLSDGLLAIQPVLNTGPLDLLSLDTLAAEHGNHGCSTQLLLLHALNDLCHLAVEGRYIVTVRIILDFILRMCYLSVVKEIASEMLTIKVGLRFERAVSFFVYGENLVDLIPCGIDILNDISADIELSLYRTKELNRSNEKIGVIPSFHVFVRSVHPTLFNDSRKSCEASRFDRSIAVRQGIVDTGLVKLYVAKLLTPHSTTNVLKIFLGLRFELSGVFRILLELRTIQFKYRLHRLKLRQMLTNIIKNKAMPFHNVLVHIHFCSSGNSESSYLKSISVREQGALLHAVSQSLQILIQIAVVLIHEGHLLINGSLQVLCIEATVSDSTRLHLAIYHGGIGIGNSLLGSVLLSHTVIHIVVIQQLVVVLVGSKLIEQRQSAVADAPVHEVAGSLSWIVGLLQILIQAIGTVTGLGLCGGNHPALLADLLVQLVDDSLTITKALVCLLNGPVHLVAVAVYDLLDLHIVLVRSVICAKSNIGSHLDIGRQTRCVVGNDITDTLIIQHSKDAKVRITHTDDTAVCAVSRSGLELHGISKADTLEESLSLVRVCLSKHSLGLVVTDVIHPLALCILQNNYRILASVN